MEPFTVRREFENPRRQFVRMLTVFIERPYGERFILEPKYKPRKGVGAAPCSMNIVTVLLFVLLISTC